MESIKESSRQRLLPTTDDVHCQGQMSENKDICKSCTFVLEHDNPPDNLIISYGYTIFA